MAKGKKLVIEIKTCQSCPFRSHHFGECVHPDMPGGRAGQPETPYYGRLPNCPLEQRPVLLRVHESVKGSGDDR